MCCTCLQNSDEDQFLFETTAQAPVQDTISQLTRIHNLRHRITRLKLEGEELAKYGPAKHPEKQGIDKYSDQAIDKGDFYNMDPTGRRTGNGEPTLEFIADIRAMHADVAALVGSAGCCLCQRHATVTAANQLTLSLHLCVLLFACL